MRLFSAILLPEETRECISSICRGIPGTKWTSEEMLHLTLAFFGEVERECFLDLSEALSEISFEPFSVAVEGVGQFLNAKEINTLWAGIAAEESLMSLQSDIAKAARELHIPLEKRKFAPHITIARIKNAKRNEVRDYMDEYSEFRCESFLCDSFHLLSSRLNPEGAVHTIERSYES